MYFAVFPIITLQFIDMVAWLLVEHTLEIICDVLFAKSFFLLSCGSLLFFKPVFLGSSEVELAFLKCSLVRSEPWIGSRKESCQMDRQVVEIGRERWKVIHVRGHFRLRVYSPNEDFFACQRILGNHLGWPFAEHLPDVFRALFDRQLSFNIVLGWFAPACFLEVKHEFVDCSVFAYLLSGHHPCVFDVHFSKDKVVNLSARPFCRVGLIVPCQLHMGQSYRGYLQTCSPEGCLHVGVEPKLVTLTLCIANWDWRVMANLLSNELVVFVQVLVGLT